MLYRAPAIVSAPCRAATIEADTMLALTGTTAAIADRACPGITVLTAHPITHLIDHAALAIGALVVPKPRVAPPATTTDAIKIATGTALAV